MCSLDFDSHGFEVLVRSVFSNVGVDFPIGDHTQKSAPLGFGLVQLRLQHFICKLIPIG